jgi:hypothetical protein
MVLVYGLEQEIDGTKLKAPDGVMIMGSNKNELKINLFELAEQIETRSVLHLHIQKYQVGLVVANGPNPRLHSIGFKNIVGHIQKFVQKKT